ncbi:hypothetical protein WKW77_25630 [Variovorax ureilyticus]|uniref:Secreted protein n=1 Tax=Variovorax ureilyticus TaxID=1836198 RepID=A0ABU8VLD7_9BURK
MLAELLRALFAGFRFGGLTRLPRDCCEASQQDVTGETHGRASSSSNRAPPQSGQVSPEGLPMCKRFSMRSTPWLILTFARERFRLDADLRW